MKNFFQSLFTPAPPCPPDLAMREHIQRFQCQPWYIRLWRYRHYLPIPFKAVRWWISDHTRKDGRKEPFDLFWGLAIGLAQGPMKWYYTMFETFARIQKRFGKEHAEQWREIFEEEP
jgi:hypothetical protein